MTETWCSVSSRWMVDFSLLCPRGIRISFTPAAPPAPHLPCGSFYHAPPGNCSRLPALPPPGSVPQAVAVLLAEVGELLAPVVGDLRAPQHARLDQLAER